MPRLDISRINSDTNIFKTSWLQITEHGVSTLIHTNLVHFTLTMASVTIGFTTAWFAFLMLYFTKPNYNKDGEFYPVITTISLFIGLQVANVFLVGPKSAISTFFLCLARNPETCERNFPFIWQYILDEDRFMKDKLLAGTGNTVSHGVGTQSGLPHIGGIDRGGLRSSITSMNPTLTDSGITSRHVNGKVESGSNDSIKTLPDARTAHHSSPHGTHRG